MKLLIQRNFYLYFRNKSGIFFSLLGAMVSFFLYIIFLKESFIENWSNFNHKIEILDYWLLSGTLAITAITTTLSGLSQFVQDKEKGVDKDWIVTDLSNFKLKLSYIFSATIIGLIMQIFVASLMTIYFHFIDSIQLFNKNILMMLCIMLINSFLSTMINFLIVQKINHLDNFGRVSSIISTVTGFFVGVYIPIGSLPNIVQSIMKIFPGNYVASLFRQLFLNDLVSNSFTNVNKINEFNAFMGIKIKFLGFLNFNETFGILFLMLIISLFMGFILSFKKLDKGR